MRKILNRSLGIVFTGVTVLFVLLGAMNYFSSPDGSGLFGYKGYVVTSNSMQPTFSAGDYIIVKVENFDDLKERDVITFLDEGTIVTHRIADKTKEGYETRGDANDVNDMMPVKEEDYIGTLQKSFAGLGSLIISIQQPIVFPIILFMAGLYIIYLYYTGNEEEEKNK